MRKSRPDKLIKVVQIGGVKFAIYRFYGSKEWAPQFYTLAFNMEWIMYPDLRGLIRHIHQRVPSYRSWWEWVKKDNERAMKDAMR